MPTRIKNKIRRVKPIEELMQSVASIAKTQPGQTGLRLVEPTPRRERIATKAPRHKE